MLKVLKVFILLSLFGFSNALADDNKLVLFYEFKKGERTIYLNAKPIKFQNALHELENEIRVRGKHAEVITLFDGQLSFDEYDNIRGLLEKVGFLNVTYFHIGETKLRMARIEPTQQVIPIPQHILKNLPHHK